MRDRQLHAFGCSLMPMVAASQVKLERVSITRVPSTDWLWPTGERRLKRIYDRLGDLVVDCKHVDHFPVVSGRPELVAICDVDETSGYPQRHPGPPNAAFEHTINVKLPTDFLDIGFHAAKVERRGPRRHL